MDELEKLAKDFYNFCKPKYEEDMGERYPSWEKADERTSWIFAARFVQALNFQLRNPLTLLGFLR